MNRLSWCPVLIGTVLLSTSTAHARHPDHSAAPRAHQQDVIFTGTPTRLSPYTNEPAWKAALHMHGILSEGDASIRSHHEAAKLLGIDVIWWTDHDHMIVSEQHRATRFSFDALSESLATGEPWSPNWVVDIVFTKSVSLFRTGFQEQSAAITNEQVAVGTGSLKMSGRRQFANRSDFSYIFNADPTRRRISVAAGLTLRLKVFPETTSADATAVMTMLLSRTVSPQIQANNRLEIQYYLSNTDTQPTRQDYIYRVPVPYTPGQWNEIVMPITDDAVAGYPFIDGRDNALTEVLIGLESKNNALAVCYFDDLRLDIEADGVPLFAAQKQMLEGYNALNDTVIHFQGIEHSSVLPHMLEYGPNTPLPDWVTAWALSPGVVDGWLVNGPAHNNFISNRVTTLAHERGAAVSYAHPFGTGTALLASTPTKEQLLAKLLATDTFNSDLLEVGYRQRERPMADHLWVWDQLALNHKYLSGLGVSDGHSGNLTEYLSDPTFSMTQFIYSNTCDEQSLADALRAGRTYYADPVIYDGVMDILADNGAVMGNIVITDRPSIDATVHIDSLTPGDQVRLIDSGSPVSTTPVTKSAVNLPATIAINPSTGSFLRAEVTSQTTGRTEKAYSNPIYFLGQVPAGGIDWRRAFVDYAGVIARNFDHFRVSSVTSAAEGDITTLSIAGQSESSPGAFQIDTAELPAGAQVIIDPPLTGEVEYAPNAISITNLIGAGVVRIALHPPCAADINGDNIVSVDDLNILLSNWGQTVAPGQSGDITADATVNVDDLNILLSQWGATCP